MVTTVRVNETTVAMLEEIKKKTNAHSLDEVITDLVFFRKKKISLFGADPELPKWDEYEDRAKSREY